MRPLRISENMNVQHMKKNSGFIAGAIILLSVAMFLTRGFWGNTNKLSDGLNSEVYLDKGAALGTEASFKESGTPVTLPEFQRTKPISTSNGVTYLPGVARSFKQIPGKLEINSKNAKWWLYARSPEEAAWLDKKGYPTPSEEAKLETLSDAGLKALVQIGDNNAKVHLIARAMKTAFKGADITKAESAASELGTSIVYDGPYAASKAMSVYSDIVKEYYLVPESERNDFQKKVLREYSMQFEIAYAMSLAYGDHTADFIHAYAVAPQDSGAISRRDVIGADIVQILSNLSRDRIGKGLAPLTLDPRPLPPEVILEGFSVYRDKTPQVIERL